MFQRFRPLIFQNIRYCHHISQRDKEIAMLYRELGDYHLRDHLFNKYYMTRSESIKKDAENIIETEPSPEDVSPDDNLSIIKIKDNK